MECIKWKRLSMALTRVIAKYKKGKNRKNAIKTLKNNRDLNNILDGIDQLAKGENVSLESYLNVVANKFNLNDWNNYSFEKDVIDEDIKAKDVYGIGGVPFFKFSDGSLIEGAQSEKLFDKILEKCIKK